MIPIPPAVLHHAAPEGAASPSISGGALAALVLAALWLSFAVLIACFLRGAHVDDED